MTTEHTLGFLQWCQRKGHDLETLTAQELEFLKAAYERSKQNPVLDALTDGPATAQQRIES